jgi:hypothetical protein
VRFLSENEVEAQEDRIGARYEYRNARREDGLTEYDARMMVAGFLTLTRGCIADPIGSRGWQTGWAMTEHDRLHPRTAVQVRFGTAVTPRNR